MSSLEKLKKQLNTDLKDYKSIPFWSWNNELDENELVKQIEEMHSVGMGGFFIHARTGLKTEYLGEKWFSCVGVCLEKAKQLNMNAWIYDENGWPSGFVGGKLLLNEEYRARFLEYKELDYFDNDALCVYEYNNGVYKRIYNKNDSISVYHTIYLRISPANTDILNPKVTEEFIKETHEKYYSRFKESFGKELVGFFTDEPQYYRYETPYTKVLLECFDKDYLFDNLIYLFKHDELGYPFRLKYYECLNKLYVNNFYKKIYDWCNDHNCMLTGHSIEEGALHAQMYGGGSVVSTYQYEHIPGVDWLGRNCGHEHSSKQVGSVKEQLGIKHVLTETFACSGYDVTIKELKSIGEFQYFNGVNMMCHHLYPYSIAGQGKHDHPPVFSKHCNWFDDFKMFNEYFDKLGYIIANTKEKYDVGIIHPIKNVYLDYIRKDDYFSVKELEDNFSKLLLKLRKNGVMFQFIDEDILNEKGYIDGNTLCVGNCSYNTIIMPFMKGIKKSTFEILQKYNGNIFFENDIKYIDGTKEDINLKSNITFDDIIKNRIFNSNIDDYHTVITSRNSELGDFIFIKNLNSYEDSKLNIKDISKEYKQLDLVGMKLNSISDDFNIEKSGSVILLKDNEINTERCYEETIKDVTDDFKIWNISDNYFVLDEGMLSYDGVNYNKKMPLQYYFDELLRNNYKGDIYIKQEVVLNNYINLKLIMEKDSFDEVYVNDFFVEFKKSSFDFNMFESDITKYLTLGKNTIIYKLNFYEHDGVNFALFDPLATESVRNCLYYDKSLENGYLKGRFIVEEDMSLSKLTKYPNVSDSMINTGYPFFYGNVLMVNDIICDKELNEEIILEINGRYQMVKVTVNDVTLSSQFDNKYNITNYLNNGRNKIKIIIYSSLRNLLGPHHTKPNPEPFGVNPSLFTYRTMWEKGIPDNYSTSYNSVFFGINSIKLIRHY